MLACILSCHNKRIFIELNWLMILIVYKIKNTCSRALEKTITNCRHLCHYSIRKYLFWTFTSQQNSTITIPLTNKGIKLLSAYRNPLTSLRWPWSFLLKLANEFLAIVSSHFDSWVINNWHSLPNYLVDANTRSRLDNTELMKICLFNFNSDITGTGSLKKLYAAYFKIHEENPPAPITSHRTGCVHILWLKPTSSELTTTCNTTFPDYQFVPRT